MCFKPQILVACLLRHLYISRLHFGEFQLCVVGYSMAEPFSECFLLEKQNKERFKEISFLHVISHWVFNQFSALVGFKERWPSG